jgi:hypothetical protein
MITHIYTRVDQGSGTVGPGSPNVGTLVGLVLVLVALSWFYTEHGIPDLFRSCGHETPFSDQKGAAKIGDSVLWFDNAAPTCTPPGSATL